MTTKVRYVYRSYLEGCGCCSSSEMYIEVKKEGDGHWEEYPCNEFISDEEELREYILMNMPHLEGCVIEDCEWF